MEITVIEGYLYTREHEWAKVEGNKAKVGITVTRGRSSATSPTSSPAGGKAVKQAEFLAGIESVKAQRHISPLSGTITSNNPRLDDEPEPSASLVTKKAGWRIELSDPAETKNLMDAASYKTYAAGLE